MSSQLIATIYEKTKNFHDPISNKPYDQNNSNISITCNNGHANIAISVSPENKAKYIDLTNKLKEALQKIPDLLSINVILTSDNNTKPSEVNRKFLNPAKNIIAIASGKGGVGKSTFAINFAVALQKLGNKVGLLDADIYGPSVPRMMGITGKPKSNDNKKLVPLKNYDVSCMSIGFLIDVDTPAIWRGPMVMKALEQMFNGVEWDNLDYLIIDLPPGTGDAQLTLAQSSKLSGSIIISTPQDVALIDVRKSINMFKKVNVPILGIVENMSYFICSKCNERHEIFSSGGAKEEAEKFKVDFLGDIPIDKRLRIFSDEGRPVCIAEPNDSIAKKYTEIAKKISLNNFN